MPWRKSPPGLVDLFEQAVPRRAGIERRQMFGYPAAFLNGNLFAGLHQESFLLRLPAADRERAHADHGARAFEPMPGRPMREYVVMLAPLLGDRRALAARLSRSIRYAGSLPPKPERAPRRAGRAKRGKEHRPCPRSTCTGIY